MFAAPGDFGSLIFALVALFFTVGLPALKAYMDAQAAKKLEQEERARRTGQRRNPNAADAADTYEPSRPGQEVPSNSDPRQPRREGHPRQRQTRKQQRQEELRQSRQMEPQPDVPTATSTLARFDSTLPSSSVFDASQPLATSIGLSGLSAEALPSDHNDRIYDETSLGLGAGTAASPFAADLLQLFSSPHSMQQAILLTEIMQRREW